MSQGLIPITHEQLRAQVVELAILLGYKAQWHWRSYHSPSGWPDLFLVKGNRIVVVELKVAKDQISLAQQEWFDVLEATGKVETYVWRDTTDFQEIVKILQEEVICNTQT